MGHRIFLTFCGFSLLLSSYSRSSEPETRWVLGVRFSEASLSPAYYEISWKPHQRMRMSGSFGLNRRKSGGYKVISSYVSPGAFLYFSSGEGASPYLGIPLYLEGGLSYVRSEDSEWRRELRMVTIGLSTVFGIEYFFQFRSRSFSVSGETTPISYEYYLSYDYQKDEKGSSSWLNFNLPLSGSMRLWLRYHF